MVASHGVTIRRVSITAARPPEDFLRSEEARQLAVLQRSEQTERQALALQRQAVEEVRERQKVLAQVEREREALQIQIQQAAARKQIAELEAAAEELRLAKQGDLQVSLAYGIYAPGDASDKPTGGPVRVRFKWDGATLAPVDPLPPPEQRTPGRQVE